MSAAWYAKFATVNSSVPRSGPLSPMTAVGATHSAVNASRNGSRRPPRSDSAPRTGETMAFTPTLIRTARPSTSCPVAGPNRASSISHRPIAPDTIANEKMVFAKSYRVHAAWARGRRLRGSGASTAAPGTSNGEAAGGCMEPSCGWLITSGRSYGYAPGPDPGVTYDPAVDEHEAVVELATAWRPQRPGRRPVRDIVDAIVEPDWAGARVVAALTPARATIVHEGAPVSVPDDLLQALLDGFSASGAIVEGTLTTQALRSGEGAAPPGPKIERPPILVPRFIRPNVEDDPYVRARDHEGRVETMEPRILEALEQGERHAFVATDLLSLDDQPLDDVPLLERKRLLEGVLEPSFLVRISPYVRPSAILTLVTWGNLGFRELHYRAANSWYRAGEETPDPAVGRPPEGPTRGPVVTPAAR